MRQFFIGFWNVVQTHDAQSMPARGKFQVVHRSAVCGIGRAMTDPILEELLAARRHRERCVLVTVAATTGSAPRAAGAKMLVRADGRISGTIGGGKFEALVIAEARGAREVFLKTYPLREDEPDSFGAICGGEVTVLIEPQAVGEALVLVGAGHCAQAIARLAGECGMHVTVLDDRAELLDAEAFAASRRVGDVSGPDFISGRTWAADEALIIVSRNFEIDQAALDATLRQPGIGYVGMIGSRRKVLRVFDEMRRRGHAAEAIERVHAPIGLDIGADAPAEIAVSVVAEALMVLRRRSGRPMKLL